MGKWQTFFHSEDVNVMTIWQKHIGPDFRQFYAREGRILNLFENFSEKSLKEDLRKTARDGVHFFTF